MGHEISMQPANMQHHDPGEPLHVPGVALLGMGPMGVRGAHSGNTWLVRPCLEKHLAETSPDHPQTSIGCAAASEAVRQQGHGSLGQVRHIDQSKVFVSSSAARRKDF
mmetsp:Transcript_44440/g.99984  ORF Transcript_44440/g.99984 Transcript_44440/m.99984 type:complete len:108 (-) Transcript_44440:7-330(-)